MKQYSITHCEEAVNALSEHYNDNKTNFNNLFYYMLWKEPRERFEVVQIGSKQAWVITDTLTGNKYLQSYHTIVSIYFKDTDEIKHLGKWSVTTSRHQGCFYRYCK